MRILYITVHEPLAYDEVSLFEGLGHEVFVGSRVPHVPVGPPRLRPAVGVNVTWDKGATDYDAIVVAHNVDALKRAHDMAPDGQRIIWRTIGQSTPRIEAFVARECTRAEIVRYSPLERRLGNFAGETALIRFYKDPSAYRPWSGSNGINMLSMGFNRRGLFGHDMIEEMLSPFDWSLYGVNPDHPRSRGDLSYDAMPQMLSESSVFVASHSTPASYTLNLIEAMMAGTPVVAINRKALERHPKTEAFPPDLPALLYEGDEILADERLLFSDADEGRRAIRSILGSRRRSEGASEAVRARAIDLFGLETIRQQWAEFLG